MPNMDGTGPDGKGPKSGRQMGKCEGSTPQGGRMGGYGARGGRGRCCGSGARGGFRRGMGRFQAQAGSCTAAQNEKGEG